ncbi:MAG: hypothetical protein IJS08_15545 [Victivallales bacterium]|nr:hypothetical protein [Victivallales bacterium]
MRETRILAISVVALIVAILLPAFGNTKETAVIAKMSACNVRDYGAVGDGRTKDTVAIQAAIDALAAKGGGRVLFPAGTYLSGTIYLKDHITLDLEAGATILGSPDKEDYNADDFCVQNHMSKREKVSGAHLIVAVEVKNIAIVGQGAIDGNRQAYYGDEVLENAPDHFKLKDWRPGQMVYLCECQYVTLSGVSMNNAPYWTCLLHGCDDVRVSDLHIYNDYRTINGDGLDIDCCRRVVVTNCNISSGDDAITLRGNVRWLKDKTRICKDITISNCVLQSRCNAFRIGVGNTMVRDCTLSNIVVHDSRVGICIQARYSYQSPGTPIENIQFENIYLGCKRPFSICSETRGIRDVDVPMIRNISMHHIRGTGCWSCYILGNTGRQIRNIKLSDVRFDYYGGADNSLEENGRKYAPFGLRSAFYPFYIENVNGIVLDDVHVNVDKADKPLRWKGKVFMKNSKEGLAEDERWLQ